MAVCVQQQQMSGERKQAHLRLAVGKARSEQILAHMLAPTKDIAFCLHHMHAQHCGSVDECTLRFLRLGTDSASDLMPWSKGITTARYSSDEAIDTMLMSGRSKPKSLSSSHGNTLRRCS